MKKFISLMMCLVVVLGMVASASAATTFAYKGSQFSDMVAWSSPAQSSGKRWHMTWSACNLSGRNRAAVRIMAHDGTNASALWVYSTPSTKYHDYYASAAYGRKYPFVTGRSDDRDKGEIFVVGFFHN